MELCLWPNHVRWVVREHPHGGTDQFLQIYSRELCKWVDIPIVRDNVIHIEHYHP